MTPWAGDSWRPMEGVTAGTNPVGGQGRLWARVSWGTPACLASRHDSIHLLFESAPHPLIAERYSDSVPPPGLIGKDRKEIHPILCPGCQESNTMWVLTL